MRNLITGLIFIIFFSCSIPEDQWYELPGLVYIWDNIKSLNDVERWIDLKIKYKADKNDFWQYPAETLTKGKGDCEDEALLMMAMAYKLLKKKPMLVIYYYPKMQRYHAEVVYNKVEYCIGNNPDGRYIVEIYNFNDIQQKIKYKRWK